MQYEIRTLLGERIFFNSAAAALDHIETGSLEAGLFSIRRDGVVVSIEDLGLTAMLGPSTVEMA